MQLADRFVTNQYDFYDRNVRPGSLRARIGVPRHIRALPLQAAQELIPNSMAVPLGGHPVVSAWRVAVDTALGMASLLPTRRWPTGDGCVGRRQSSMASERDGFCKP